MRSGKDREFAKKRVKDRRILSWEKSREKERSILLKCEFLPLEYLDFCCGNSTCTNGYHVSVLEIPRSDHILSDVAMWAT